MASVLIVDDQLISRMILEELVRSIDANLSISTFESPMDALDWAKKNAVDLVLADYKMPVMDGVEFTQWLRKIPDRADVPLVMITCLDDKAVRYKALEAGATDFLTKPIDHHECRARCKNLLTLRQQQCIIRDRANWLEGEVIEKTRALRQRENETLMRLARVSGYRDVADPNHHLRISCITRLMAESLGQPAEFCNILEHAAPLYDIGKVGIADHILTKDSPLTDEERRSMERHARIGYDILQGSPSEYLQMGANIAWCHHERFDGLGYPRGLKGQAIPLEARLVSVVSVLDAMLSTRPYRPARPLEESIAWIQSGRGQHFDPDCIDVLTDNLDRILASRELLNDYQTTSSDNLAALNI